MWHNNNDDDDDSDEIITQRSEHSVRQRGKQRQQDDKALADEWRT